MTNRVRARGWTAVLLLAGCSSPSPTAQTDAGPNGPPAPAPSPSGADASTAPDSAAVDAGAVASVRVERLAISTENPNVQVCVVTDRGRVRCAAGRPLLSTWFDVQDAATLARAPDMVTLTHTRALDTMGNVYWVGTNPVGAVSGVLTERLTSGARAVGQGLHHTCWATPSGGARCFGDNVYGEVGASPGAVKASSPVDVAGASRVVQLALGFGHSCALRDDGHVDCWGLDAEGELGALAGLQVTREGFPYSTTPVRIAGVDGATSLAAAATSTCAIVGDRSVRCWGDHQPVAAVAGVADARAIAAGYTHYCVLDGAGRVTCWGANASGQLGRPAAGLHVPPGVVPGVTATAVAADGDSTCALVATGVTCWGAGMGEGGRDAADPVSLGSP